MDGTSVKIAADGSVELLLDLYYEETGMYILILPFNPSDFRNTFSRTVISHGDRSDYKLCEREQLFFAQAYVLFFHIYTVASLKVSCRSGSVLFQRQ